MTTRLSPIVFGCETQEQASSYDRWFKAKIEASLANLSLGVPHDEVMARMDAIIEAAERKQRENT
ncbi:MAG: stability determinant [Pseudomonadota bacterium]